ncbi:phytanoyl- dioxygenase family protein [Fusarium oxysporum f. sp. phaseoli]
MQLEGRGRPDISYLVATVNEASATWQSDREESKLGKLKTKFHSLCETCHDHSSSLAIVPKDDKYITLLTGSLSAIAQATINYQNIAEGVADTLDDLSHDIDFCNRQMMEHGNIPSLCQYIQELYVIVFEFFTEVFNKWSKSGWKRFLTSFDDGAFNRLFTTKKERMLAIERRMERHVNLDFRHRTTEYLEMVIQSQKEHLYRLPNQLNEQILFLGDSLQQLLEQQQHGKTPAGFGHKQIQAELTKFTTQWKNQVEHLTEAVTQSSLLQIDGRVYHRLQTWLRDLSSTNLWIRGPHNVSRPGQNSMTAVSLTALARTHNIPFVAYFCTFTDHDALGTSKRAGFEAFMASIVTQLVQLIPERDVAETLQLVRDVRELGPRLVHVFIDNLQVLEDQSNKADTRDFPSAIEELCRLNGGNRLPESAAAPDTSELFFGTMICFTTEGYVDGLAQAVELQLLDKVEFDRETTEPISMEIIAAGYKGARLKQQSKLAIQQSK